MRGPAGGLRRPSPVVRIEASYGMMGEESAEPLAVAGAGPAVVAFHGFGGVPGEVRLVVEAARELGLTARAPLLPGHGANLVELSRHRWDDWRAHAEASLAECYAAHGPVVLAGLSMGALLATDLAATYPERVCGLVALAPAIRLHWPFPALALAAACRLGVPDFAVLKTGPDIRDARQRRAQLTTRAQPVYSANDVRRAGKRVLGKAGQVRCPALVVHGVRDRVCPVSGARALVRALGTPARDKELLLLPRSAHIVTRDLERGLLRERLACFLAAARAEREARSEAGTP